MFIRNAANLLALKNEVINDPLAIGYAGNNTQGLLDLLNLPANNPGGESSTNRIFTGFDLLESCTTSNAEYDAAVNTPLRILLVESLVRLNEESVPVRFKNELMGVFSNALAPTIRAAIIAEATGPQSRAEVLFGDDVIIIPFDLTLAGES